MRNLIKLGSIVSIAWFAAAALTPLTSVAIRNSTIDSTAIGGTTPTVVRSTYSQETSIVPSTLPTQGFYQAWDYNAGTGDADFFDHPGTGGGGYNWYQSNSSGTGFSKLMSLSAGVLSMGTLNAGGVTAQGQYPSTTGFVNGAWLNWNQSSGGGETDFVNQHAGGAGGFSWYDTTSATTPGGFIAHLDEFGNLTALHVSAANGFTGGLTGNASTASAFDHTPTVCPSGQVSAGVNSVGNAVCIPMVQSASGPGGVTGSSSYSTTSSTVTLTPGYGDAAYQASCALVSPSDPRAYIYGITKAPGSINVLVTTGGSVAITYVAVDCFAKHN